MKQGVYKPIAHEAAEALHDQVVDLYALPDAIISSKHNSTHAKALVSVGKPWYDYFDREGSLTRVRAMENWNLDDTSGGLRAGSFRVVIEHVFPGSNDLNFGVHEDNDGSEQLVLVDNPVNAFSDVWMTKTFSISKLGPEEYLASALKISMSDNNSVAPTDSSRDYEGMLDRFFYQEPLFELGLSYVELDPYQLESITEEIKDFSATEKQLALQRTTAAV